MLHIVIDTSIYRTDPWRKKAAFKAVERLAKADKLKLHVPYFVKEELISFARSEYENHVDKLQQEISRLQQKPLSKKLTNQLNKFRGQFETIKDDLTRFPETEISQWFKNVGANMHPISETHGVKVVSDYFEGVLPFRAKKNRDDFPDAFIWQVIADISEDTNKLYVIVGDKGLLNACQTRENITTFSTLDDFISSDVCKPLLRETTVSENLARLNSILPMTMILREQDIKTKIERSLQWFTVHSYQIPDDNNEAKISATYTPDFLEIDEAKIQYYGYGNFIVPFEASLIATLDYALFKADYYVLDEEKIRSISISELNDHYFEVEEDYSLVIQGTLSISVTSPDLEKEQLSDSELEKLLLFAMIEVDSINEVEIA